MDESAYRSSTLNLGEGDEVILDEQTGESFLYNVHTGKSTWIRKVVRDDGRIMIQYES